MGSMKGFSVRSKWNEMVSLFHLLCPSLSHFVWWFKLRRYVLTKREDNCEVEGVEPFLHKTRSSGFPMVCGEKSQIYQRVNLVEAEVLDRTAIHHSKGFLSLHLLSFGPTNSVKQAGKQACKHVVMYVRHEGTRDENTWRKQHVKVSLIKIVSL